MAACARPMPRELEEDGQPMPEEGLFLVGDRGKLLAGFTAGEPAADPEGPHGGFETPPQSLPRPIEEFAQWIRACSGPRSSGRQLRAAPMTETILPGTIALRGDKKLVWDGQHGRFVDAPEADALHGAPGLSRGLVAAAASTARARGLMLGARGESMPHLIDAAPTGRAKCRGCGGKIDAGALRFGEALPNPFAEGETTHWFHLECGAFKRP